MPGHVTSVDAGLPGGPDCIDAPKGSELYCFCRAQTQTPRLETL